MELNKRNSRNKLLLKYFLRVRCTIQNRDKILKFKKLKWKTFLFHLNQRYKKTNLFYRIFDQDAYFIPRFTSLFKRKFKQNLQNKKKFSLYYGGLSNKIIKKYMEGSMRKVSKVTNLHTVSSYLIESLESRLDVIILRTHFVLSIRSAQQLITHGHVYVNNVKVTKKNYVIRKGDHVSFSKKVHPLLISSVSRSRLWPLPPKYIQINYRIFQFIIVDFILYTNISMNFDQFLNLTSVVKNYKK